MRNLFTVMLFNFFRKDKEKSRSVEREADTIAFHLGSQASSVEEDEDTVVFPDEETSVDGGCITHIIPPLLDYPVLDGSECAVVLSADGSTLALHEKLYHDVCCYATQSRELLSVVPVKEYDSTMHLHLSPKGDLLVTGSRFEFDIHEVETAKCIRHGDDADDCFFAAFRPDGKSLAFVVGDLTHSVVLGPIEEHEGKLIHMKGWFHRAVYSPNGKRMAVIYNTNMTDGESLNLLLADTEKPAVVSDCKCMDMYCFSPDSSMLAYCAESESGNPMLIVQSAESGEQLWEKELTALPVSLAFTPDGRALVVETDTSVTLLKLHRGETASVKSRSLRPEVCSAAGGYVASLKADNSLCISRRDKGTETSYADTPQGITGMEFYGERILYIHGKEFSVVLDVEKLTPLCRINHTVPR